MYMAARQRHHRPEGGEEGRAGAVDDELGSGN